MSIPTNRADLVRRAEEAFARLEDAIDTLAGSPQPDADPVAEAAQAAETPDGAAPAKRDRDAVDVLNHLHAWHVLLLGWLDDDAAGRTPAFPADGYTWRELDELNRELRDRYRGNGDLDFARERLRASHRAALARLDRFDDASIFSDGRAWLSGGTLVEPVHECLGGHYGWALGALPGLPIRSER